MSLSFAQLMFRGAPSHVPFLSHKHTCAVDTADTVGMLQRVLLQVSVQAEAGLPTASDPLQLGQVCQVTGRCPLPVALGDGIIRGRTLTG